VGPRCLGTPARLAPTAGGVRSYPQPSLPAPLARSRLSLPARLARSWLSLPARLARSWLSQPVPLARSRLSQPVPLARSRNLRCGSWHGTWASSSAPAGSITREDVHAAAGAPSGVPIRAPSFGPDREQRIPIKGVRRLTAENMVASAFTAPHVTEFLTVDVTRTLKALDRLRDMPDWRGLRISPLLLVAKAVLLAVRRHPMVNSTWSGETGEIIVKEYVNLGIAAATPRGLLVPNIKDAGRLSMLDLAESMSKLVATAREGRTTPADMAGGTFTITNVGVFGVDTGTPILPVGEAAILAFGAVREMPWVHKGRIRPRRVTTLGLSFDHRIVDGELGSLFLRDIGVFLGDPEVALLAWT
jgi:2-oxoisovalerate dehydrogenase E2 component (dihydrolipoyl transacylase)